MKKLILTGAIALTMVVSAPTMQAQTVAELQALINQLMAQIAAMQGGQQTTTTSTYVNPGVTLRVGSQGAAVVALQSTLNSLGHAVGNADGSFGPMTRSGVVAFQASKGLTADGIAGPMTHNALVQATATTTTVPTEPGTPSGELQGGAGEAYITSTSVDVDDEVREGTTQKVLGARVEAQDSDVQLTNLRVVLENVDAPNSNRRPDRYLSEIQVWLDGQVVGKVDANELNRDGNVYSRNITLTDAIVREGSANRADLYIAFRALSNIDSLDMADARFNLDVEQIRFVDGSGAVLTSNYTQTIVATPGAFTDGITFTDLASSGEVELRASLGNNNPAEQNIQVNEFSTTNDVTLLEFRLNAKGTDMMVEQLDVDLTTTGSDVDEILAELRLMRGSQTLADISTFTAATMTDTVTFDLYDELDMEEGDTETLKVVAKFLKQDGNFADGDTIRVALDTSSIIAEDKDGNVLPGTSLAGSANGNIQTLFVDGAMINFVSSTSTATNQANTSRDFVIVFEVEAIGEDVVVDRTMNNATGIQHIIVGGTPDSSSFSISSNAQLTGNHYTVYEGQTRQFTLTVNVSNVGAAGQTGIYRIALDAVQGIAPAMIIESVSATVNND